MTDKVLVFNGLSAVADTIEAFYESPALGNGTKIKTFTASNDTLTSQSYKAYIYNSAGVAAKSVVPFTIVVRDTADYGASIIGQVIPTGGTLRIESSNASGLNFYVTGVDL